MAVVWDASLDVTAKLMAGRAFRAPSFNEVYSITNPVALGNPNLIPETVTTVEAAVSWQARRDLQLNLSLFHLEMRDTIRLVSGTYANTGALHGDADAGADLQRAAVEVELAGAGNQAHPHHGLLAAADGLDRAVDDDRLARDRKSVV